MLNLSKRKNKEGEHEKSLNLVVPTTKIKEFKESNFGVKNFILKVTIHGIEGVDPPSVYPEVQHRVIVWVNPKFQYVTNKVTRFPAVISIPLNNVVTLESMFLSAEVIDEWSSSDPGTSTGIRVVGRAKVPLPQVTGIKQGRRIGLVRFVDGRTVAEGHIMTSMQIFPPEGTMINRGLCYRTRR